MKTILVVDDECFLVMSLTQLLEEAGYHVVSATNGKDGLAQLVKEHPDMVLTDFMMPVADGLEMVRGMHALPEFRSLPVLVMSVSPKRVALSTRMVKVTAFLSKPFGLDELLPHHRAADRKRRTWKGLEAYSGYRAGTLESRPYGGAPLNIALATKSNVSTSPGLRRKVPRYLIRGRDCVCSSSPRGPFRSRKSWESVVPKALDSADNVLR